MINSNKIGQKLAEKTFVELAKPEKSLSRSRICQDPKGYQYLGVWQNSALLRVLIRVFTKGLPRSEYRLKAQMDDEARSVKRNIEEGFKRPTTSEYLQFLSYSQASLEELRGDLRDSKTDGLLVSVPGSNLQSLGFNLGIFKGPNKGNLRVNLRVTKSGIADFSLRRTLNRPLTTLIPSLKSVSGEPTEPGHPYFRPLTTLNPANLSFEILMELANKTDYLLRRLVVSLEKKLTADQKAYQIERARVRENLRWYR